MEKELKTEDRIYLVEQHLKEIQKDISNISSALVGNKENGNRGFIHEIKDIKDEVVEIQKELNKLQKEFIKKDLYISKLEYVICFVIGVIITAAITALFKK